MQYPNDPKPSSNGVGAYGTSDLMSPDSLKNYQQKSLNTSCVCPNCGRCPTCGRGVQQYPHYPYGPTWIVPLGSTGVTVPCNHQHTFCNN